MNCIERYVDFIQTKMKRHALAKFNWEDHAFSVLHKYHKEAVHALHRQSDFAFEMTNGQYGQEQV